MDKDQQIKINLTSQNDNSKTIKINTTNKISKGLIANHYLDFYEELGCSICDHLVNNPVKCKKCDGLYCISCINKHLEIEKHCPSEKKNGVSYIKHLFEISQAPFAITNMLSKIKIKCVNNNLGCSSILMVRDLKNHLDSCDFEYITCDNCDQVDFRKNYHTHLKLCLSNIANFKKCQFCSEEIIKSKYIEHYQTCNSFTENCALCNTLILRDFKLNHLITECQFFDCVCDMCKESSIKVINNEGTVDAIKKSKLIIKPN